MHPFGEKEWKSVHEGSTSCAAAADGCPVRAAGLLDLLCGGL